MNLPHSTKRNFTNGEGKLLAGNDLTRNSASDLLYMYHSLPADKDKSRSNGHYKLRQGNDNDSL